VGLIVFQKDRASMVLPPTNSVVLAKKALANIPVGGKTPLSAGLLMAYETIKREKSLHPDIVPLLILLTDGAGNVSMSNLPPIEEGHRIADLIKDDQIKTVTINMEHVAFDQGLATKLAERMGGPCYSLGQLRADILYQTVKQEMGN
jgi:magnesium chelatase subunit D